MSDQPEASAPSIQTLLERALPPGATVLVEGGADLAPLLHRFRVWSFPVALPETPPAEAPAGVGAAIEQLEAMRARGAEFLVLSASGAFSGPEYADFRKHLEERYRHVLRRPKICDVYAVVERRRRPERYARGLPADEIATLFDAAFYSATTGIGFPDNVTALVHYLESGFAEGYSPHPLFDAAYYREHNIAGAKREANPLLHFLEHGAERALDPSPYFDTEYYYTQGPGLRRRGVNALVHYIRWVGENKAYHPNPLFRNGFYLAWNPEVAEDGENPFTHFLQAGADDRRLASPAHRAVVDGVAGATSSGLRRGSWKQGVVLFVHSGKWRPEIALATGAVLTEQYRLGVLTVFLEAPDLPRKLYDRPGVVVLDGLDEGADLLRPSALRLLVRSLAPLEPLFALTDVPEIETTLQEQGIPFYFFASDAPEAAPLTRSGAARTILASAETFEALRRSQSGYPPNVALRSYGPPVTATDLANDEKVAVLHRYAQSILDLARRDFSLDAKISFASSRPPDRAIRRIVVLCADWSISGVNTALHAVGSELVRKGWEVELLFTRDAEAVLASTGSGAAAMPALPHRFVEPKKPGVEGMWEAVIADLEQGAPCIVLLSYDFVANSVAPALSNRIGVVAWAQADDGDYYEQVYRLGRYCNAVVCVSDTIREKIAALNPGIAEHAVVIRNASVSEREIVDSKQFSGDAIRIVYTGRLVQYQKRIVDFVDLADALERAEVPFRITLIGDFTKHDEAGKIFPARAQTHLEAGTIVLPGRLSREQILGELERQDFFVLLSDFEGLPLSLLEGMARGCVPVVAAMESGVPEIVTFGDNGLVISGRDYDEWARLLVELWQDDDRRTAMSARARATIRESFSIEQAAVQFDELFTRIASELARDEYQRPPSLHWGASRSPTGDVLPPPNMYGPVKLAGVR
jgi:glycosyltransferase involved in cell wall biosynthesis